jgi:hypothetical protein
MWDDAGQNIIEHLAGVEDFEVAGGLSSGREEMAQGCHHLAGWR